MVTMALATAAPAGSTTVPSMVPAFPSDWPNRGGTMMAKSRNSEPRARVFFILPVLGVEKRGPSLISPAGGILHGRAGNFHERARLARVNSPLQDLPDLVSLALADHQLKPVAEGDVPALAAKRGELADVIHIDDGVAVHPLELRSAEAILDGLQRLRGVQALFGSDDPDQFALGLKGEHLIGIQKYIVGSAAAHHLADPGRMLRSGDRGDAGDPVGNLDRPLQQTGGALHRLLQARFGDRLEQVVDRAGLESLNRILVEGCHDHDDRQQRLPG